MIAERDLWIQAAQRFRVGAVQSEGSDLATPEVAERFYRRLTPEDISDRGPDVLVTELDSMIRWARQRRPGDALVRAVIPNRGEVDYSIFEVVTDDMPFLVDSVTASLVHRGHDVRLVIHPQLAVLRDSAGTLTKILDIDQGDAPPEACRESWMRLEVTRNLVVDELEPLVARIRRVLGDVAKAVSDWGSMKSKALDVAAELETRAIPFVDANEIKEAQALLNWIADDNLTFLGYRCYDLTMVDGYDALRPLPGSGLGILRQPAGEAPESKSFALLPLGVRAKAREPKILVMSKANSRSNVHRVAYMDYIGVKRFDREGNVIGEHRFLGLYAASAYVHSVADIPVLRDKLNHVMRVMGYLPGSHSAKDLLQFMETYPRDELFQIDPDLLAGIADSVLHLQETRRTHLYLRDDDYGRFVSALVYLPRDRYTTDVRLRIEAILMEAFGGSSVEFTTRVTESVLARIHYVVRLPAGHGLPMYDEISLQERVVDATQSWSDEFDRQLIDRVGVLMAPDLLKSYRGAFAEGFKEDFEPSHGVEDALLLESLEPGELSIRLRAPVVSDSRDLRFSMARIGPAISLTEVLPILQGLGVEVVDEHPYEIRRSGQEAARIVEFGVVLPQGNIYAYETLFARFREAFKACWNGRCEVDAFNGLVVSAGLRWEEVVILRAYSRYERQIGSSFGHSYQAAMFRDNATVARLLIDLFMVRFDPEGSDNRTTNEDELVRRLDVELDAVPSLDADRMMRHMKSLILASVRTNYFLLDMASGENRALAMKLQPRRVPGIPAPTPEHEIWSYSPRVEGVHMRFGSIARGGLRWSDRREDFRTEVLGLAKAQAVKNAVIVPEGAKGGFVTKETTAPKDRGNIVEEGRRAYEEFVSSMIDLTDNLIDGKIERPQRLVAHDGEDSYLVIAADKGTATFSDLANSVALREGFWLKDAFASGGSAGFDHKAMGITAKGAWESVKRHFREIGIDTQAHEFSVVGVGDMSGDVFGNGMLLSPYIRLIAAFDHRNIFIDPQPVADVAFAERTRLFNLNTSSWEDYDRSLLSVGGGIFSRAQKTIHLTEEMKAALGISTSDTSLTPDELINCILKAPVDLLWNGGIGTYVKSSAERSADVGDRANDSIRVDGRELRVKVVGEGGNLGLTQLGRVEAAQNGVRLNTDAIDNSAGVDTSDHEVNIKIVLDSAETQGKLSGDDRIRLLETMADEIESMVLRDNYDQNVVLGNARRGAPGLVTVHQRLIRNLEQRGLLNRSLEFLPDDEEFAQRRAAGEGLTSPELAVLLAYAKIALRKDLSETSIGLESWFERPVVEYFPKVVQESFVDHILNHPLRIPITNTWITNRLLNIGGITFVFRAMEETGASCAQVVKAALTAMEVFHIDEMWNWVNELDTRVPTTAQSALQLETRRLLDRATRWFLQTRTEEIDIKNQVDYFDAVVSRHAQGVAEMLQGNERARYERLAQRLTDAGSPPDLAAKAASSLDVFALLDITDICQSSGEDSSSVIPLYFMLSERYDVDRTLLRITALPRGDRWTALARQALRSDLYQAIAALTTNVVRVTSASQSPDARIAEWERQHAEGVSRVRNTLSEVNSVEEPDLATLSVCLRALRNLVG